MVFGGTHAPSFTPKHTQVDCNGAIRHRDTLHDHSSVSLWRDLRLHVHLGWSDIPGVDRSVGGLAGKDIPVDVPVRRFELVGQAGVARGRTTGAENLWSIAQTRKCDHVQTL